MLSRALILATVILSLVAVPAMLAISSDAQAQNLEAGKSASQIFANSCSACHRSQRGLLKTVPPGSLSGFLREHYTTSKDMAQQMSAYLLSNGATDPRGAGGLTKQGQSAKSGGQQAEPVPGNAPPSGRRLRRGQPPQEAARPDADGLTPEPRADRARRKRGEPQQQAAPGPDGQPVPADDSRLTKRQRQKLLGKKKGREEPKPAATPAPVETAKPDVPKPDAPKPDAPKPDAAAPVEAVKPAEMPKPPEPAPVVIDPKVDAPKPAPTRPAEPGKSAEPAASRPDPVPQVTPAPSTPAPEPSSASPSSAPAEAPAPHDAPPKPTISVTPPPPAPPSGPAVAPISQ